MTDADRFLAAVVAAPGDDTPRLVFADWLDEHGDPDRAEFIRAQIHLAHSPGDPALAARADDLRKAHEDEWKIPGLRGVQTFRRGFVEALRTAAAEFVAHGDRIGTAAPVVDLRLPMANEYLTDIAAVPWLPRVEALDLRANAGIGGLLAAFFAAAPLPRLRSLVLQGATLWPDAVAAVGWAAARLPALEVLDLSGNFFGDAGAEILAGTPALAGLRELILKRDMIQYEDAIHAAGAAALARSRYLTRLRRLDLAGQYVGDGGAIALATSPNAASLEVLDVSYNDIGSISDEAVEAIVRSPHLGRLRVLNLARNQLDRFGAEALAGWPHLANMAEVNLTGCDIPDAARAALLASPFADRFRLDPPSSE